MHNIKGNNLNIKLVYLFTILHNRASKKTSSKRIAYTYLEGGLLLFEVLDTGRDLFDVHEDGRDLFTLLVGLVPCLATAGSNGAVPNIFSSRRIYFFCPSNNSL